MAKRINPQIETFARIKVVGIGGAGGAAVNRMVDAGISDVEFVVINTDAQALHYNKADTKVHIGPDTTRGLGAGGDPKVGQDAAQESIDSIREAIADTDILFLTFGAGGGTGSGAAHVVAQIARDMEILTVAFVTKPFGFEAERRARNAEFAISNLEKYVDTLVIIPNDNLLDIIDPETPVEEAFKIADDVLRQGVQGITDLITVPGLINLDFADVKAIMQNSGQALMGIGRASGENRAELAAQQAINSPLLEVSINGAKGILLNAIGGKDMTLHEVSRAASVVTDAADQDVNVISGASINPDLDGEIIITVVATGFNSNYLKVHADSFSTDMSDFRSSEPKSNKNLAPLTKISKQEDLPSLPLRSNSKTEDEVEATAEAKAEATKPEPQAGSQSSPDADQDLASDIKVDEIIKDLDDNLDDDNQNTIIDEESDAANIWDDVETDDGFKLDLNKPTFLRKLAAKRKERKERREAEATEAEEAVEDAES